MLRRFSRLAQKKMTRMRFIGPNHRYTICAALRDVYVKIDDPDLKLRIEYAMMLADAIVNKLAEYDMEFLRRVYPRRREFDEIMK